MLRLSTTSFTLDVGRRDEVSPFGYIGHERNFRSSGDPSISKADFPLFGHQPYKLAQTVPENRIIQVPSGLIQIPNGVAVGHSAFVRDPRVVEK
jgi:hypothetical protein